MLENFSLWEAIKIGGPVMYFLMICSIVSIAVILERFFYYHRRSLVSRAAFMQTIKEQLAKGEVQKALMLCKETATPFSSVVSVALNSSDLDEKEISDALERQIIIEANDLERRTAIVGTIGSTAVYIGLLGTVWGIIKSFGNIAKTGSGGINVTIGGISEALVCTAAGLLVAIPAVMAYNYFVKRVGGFVMDMELCASEIISLIKGQKRLKLSEKAS